MAAEPNPLTVILVEEILAMYTEIGSGDCLAWAARDASGILSPYRFNHRVVRSDDVRVKITHCGVCYGDVMRTRNVHGGSKYPLVPGHAIVGVVIEVGSNVKGFTVGDYAGVGTYVDSCGECESCNDFLEVQCLKGLITTFNSLDSDGTIMKGGYSSYIIVKERQVTFCDPKFHHLCSLVLILSYHNRKA